MGRRDEVRTSPRSRSAAASAGTAEEPGGTPLGVWTGARGDPRHADRPPTPDEARAVLAASLGLDPGELGSLTPAGATRALARLNELVRRLADPRPSDGPDVEVSGPDAEAEWAGVRQRCLSVAVAMLEEAR